MAVYTLGVTHQAQVREGGDVRGPGSRQRGGGQGRVLVAGLRCLESRVSEHLAPGAPDDAGQDHLVRSHLYRP